MQPEEDNKPVHKGLRKGLYLIPSAFTAANIGMGFLAVLNSLRGFQVVHTNPALAAEFFNYAAVAIGFAILFDTLDGRVARMTRTSTEIGVQLDSLADVLTFGIAPLALAYSWGIGAVFQSNTSIWNLGVFVLFMYLMCGTFRLARFNLQATRPRVLMEGSPKVDKKNFVGLPIPPSAGLIASMVHFAPLPLNSYPEDFARFYGISLIVLLAALGILMVSTVRYSSFKSVGTGRINVYVVLLVAAVGMLIWTYSQYMLLILSTLYVSHGIVFYVLGWIIPRRKEKHVESNEPIA